LIPSYLETVAVQAAVMLAGPAGWIEAAVKIVLGIAQLIGEAADFKETQDIKTVAHEKITQKTCQTSGCPFFGQIEDCHSCANTVTYQWGTQVGLVVESIFTAKEIFGAVKAKGHDNIVEGQKSKIKETKQNQHKTKLKPNHEKRSKPKTITEKWHAKNKERIKQNKEPHTFKKYKEMHDRMMENRRKAADKTYKQYKEEKLQQNKEPLPEEAWQKKINTLVKYTPQKLNIIKEISQLPRNAFIALKSCVTGIDLEINCISPFREIKDIHETLGKIEKVELVNERIKGILAAASDGIEEAKFESIVQDVFFVHDFESDTSTPKTISTRDYLPTHMCEPSCPNAETLYECFGKDYQFYKKKISMLYAHKNDGTLEDNIDLLKLWQECPIPKSPSAKVRCLRVKGNCIDTRHELCDGKVLLEGDCPGSENIQCCPDYIFEHVQPLMDTAEGDFEPTKSKSGGLQKNMNIDANYLRKTVNTHIIKLHSSSPCYVGVPARMGCKDKNTLWVSDGCRADFNCAGKKVNCESWDYNKVECECSSCKIFDVELTKTNSESECVKGETYGCWSNEEMWVSNGCRGEFQCHGGTVTCASEGYDTVKCKCDKCMTGKSKDVKHNSGSS